MKKRMKQIMALLCCTSLVVSMTACKDAKEKNPKQQLTQTIEDNSSESDTNESDIQETSGKDDVASDSSMSSYSDMAQDVVDQVEEFMQALKNGDIDTICAHLYPDSRMYEKLQLLKENDPSAELLRTLLKNVSWISPENSDYYTNILESNEGVLEEYLIQLDVCYPNLFYANIVYMSGLPEGYVFPKYPWDYPNDEAKKIVEQMVDECPMDYRGDVWIDYKDGVVYVNTTIWDELEKVDFDSLCSYDVDSVYQKYLSYNLDYDDTFCIKKDSNFEFASDAQMEMRDAIEKNDIEKLYALYQEYKNPESNLTIDEELLDISQLTSGQKALLDEAVSQIKVYRANITFMASDGDVNMCRMVSLFPKLYMGTFKQDSIDFMKVNVPYTLAYISIADNEYPLAAYEYLKCYTQMVDTIKKNW